MWVFVFGRAGRGKQTGEARPAEDGADMFESECLMRCKVAMVAATLSWREPFPRKEGRGAAS